MASTSGVQGGSERRVEQPKPQAVKAQPKRAESEDAVQSKAPEKTPEPKENTESKPKVDRSA